MSWESTNSKQVNDLTKQYNDKHAAELKAKYAVNQDADAVKQAQEAANQAKEQKKTVVKSAVEQGKGSYDSSGHWIPNNQKSAINTSTGPRFQKPVEEPGGNANTNVNSEGNANTNVNSEGNANTNINPEGSTDVNVNSEGSTDVNVGPGGFAESQKTQTPPKKGDDTEGFNVKIPKLSKTFYRDLAAGLKGQRTGNAADVDAATMAEQSKNALNNKAEHSMQEQEARQIANRNEYAEAGKMASVQNDAENRQNIANRANMSGSAAALARKTNTPDVAAQQARQDEQRNVANNLANEKMNDQLNATDFDGQSKSFQVESRDFDNYLDDEHAVSKNKENKPEENKPEENKPEENKPEENKPEENKPETTQETQQQETSGDATQEAMQIDRFPRAMSMSNGSSLLDKVTPEQKAQLSQLFVDGYNGNADKWKEFQQLGNTLGKQFDPNWVPINDSAYTSKLNNESKSYDNNQQVGSDGQTVGSDYRIKDIQRVLSDMRMKSIRRDIDNNDLSMIDLMWLARRMGGKHRFQDKDYDFFDNNEWDSSVLGDYAEHIRNYVYTYKPEAREIDSSIDPEEEHIGPMAQDIEQVNPACIKETPDGVKTVDTARLALMNAGAIGDLARELNELNDKFKALGL